MITNGQIFNKFKEDYPDLEVEDYRPMHLDFVRDRIGITVWLKNGDILLYFPKLTLNEACYMEREAQCVEKIVEKIVLCPTHQRAVYEFEHLAKSFPFMWKRSMKAGDKMYLESIFGTKYIFMSESEPWKLHGLRSDFIYIDDVFNEVSKCQESQSQ